MNSTTTTLANSPTAATPARLKIALVTATFPPYYGGTGKVCYHNALELARLGHAVTVFTAGAPAEHECDGFTIKRLKPLLQVGNAPLLPGLLTALAGFDVIHLHYPFFGGEITTLAAKLRNIPLIITYHQDVFLSGLMNLIATTMRYSVGRQTLRGADRVLFTSLDYARASYVRSMLKKREKHIGELPNGVDTSVFAPGDFPLSLKKRHAELDKVEKVALLVAGLDRAHYFKGVNVFLEALAKLPPDCGAVIVGDGDLRSEYQATAVRLGIAQRVAFAGRISDEDLPLYYRLADVTVLPSVTMGEAFGLVLVESLACGTPVIATNLPGVRTVVDHNRFGRLVAPGNANELAEAMHEILSHEDLRQKLGREGRTRIEEKYDWRQIGRRLEQIYYEVLAS